MFGVDFVTEFKNRVGSDAADNARGRGQRRQDGDNRSGSGGREDTREVSENTGQKFTGNVESPLEGSGILEFLLWYYTSFVAVELHVI